MRKVHEAADSRSANIDLSIGILGQKKRGKCTTGLMRSRSDFMAFGESFDVCCSHFDCFVFFFSLCAAALFDNWTVKTAATCARQCNSGHCTDQSEFRQRRRQSDRQFTCCCGGRGSSGPTGGPAHCLQCSADQCHQQCHQRRGRISSAEPATTAAAIPDQHFRQPTDCAAHFSFIKKEKTQLQQSGTFNAQSTAVQCRCFCFDRNLFLIPDTT